MAVTFNFIDRRGPSNEIRRQLQPKQTKDVRILPILRLIFITNKMECFSFKNARIVWMENATPN